MKIAFILGTRPEIIKFYSLIKECSKENADYFIIHTNQHYDKNMDEIFFKELAIPKPKYNLDIKSGLAGNQIARMIIELEKILIKENPDIVLVQGDTNTVLAGALIASKLRIKLGHLEAGLRSYDRLMPEEINRIITDTLSDFLFVPTKNQKQILLREGINEERIFVTGNSIVDAIFSFKKNNSQILKKYNLHKNKYFLLTCHRPSNTDSDSNFESIIKSISFLAARENIECIFPVHPRLKAKHNFIRQFKNIKIIDPVGYIDLLELQNNSKMIFTDSGGIQEEACILKKKCIVLRTNTERPETLINGGIVLVKEISADQIINSYNNLINKKNKWNNPFGNGTTYNKVLKIINSR